MSWSPQQYMQFEEDRTRPVRDLLAAVPGAPGPLVDLGCGPGNSTEVLAARFPDQRVAGLDSSPDMVEAARKRLPHVPFEVADITQWQGPGPFGVILSNAVLQWVPGHATLLPRLVRLLAFDGSLAVQLPDNMQLPAHTLMREVAQAGPWAGKLAGAGGMRAEMDSAEGYYRMLRPHCRRVDVWRTTYLHVLTGGIDAVIEWFKGSGLRPYLAPLDATERALYLDRYRAKLAEAFPVLEDGSVLLPFPRLFMVATR